MVLFCNCVGEMYARIMCVRCSVFRRVHCAEIRTDTIRGNGEKKNTTGFLSAWYSYLRKSVQLFRCVEQNAAIRIESMFRIVYLIGNCSAAEPLQLSVGS